MRERLLDLCLSVMLLLLSSHNANALSMNNRRSNRMEQSSRTNAIRGRLGHLRPRLWSATPSYAPSTTSLTAAFKFRNFEEMLKSFGDSIVVVSFSADLCGPCRIMKKELNQVSTTLGEDVKMFAIDTDKFPKLGVRYEVSVLPTVVVFLHGQIHHRIEGVETADVMLERLLPLLH